MCVVLIDATNPIRRNRPGKVRNRNVAPKHQNHYPIRELWLEMVTEVPGLCHGWGLAECLFLTVLEQGGDFTGIRPASSDSSTILNTQQKVNQGLLSRTWKRGNKLSSSVLCYVGGREDVEGLQKHLSFPGTRSIVLTAEILEKGVHQGKTNGNFIEGEFFSFSLSWNFPPHCYRTENNNNKNSFGLQRGRPVSLFLPRKTCQPKIDIWIS